MPLSGSHRTELSGGYSYPGIYRPNSSYASVVMREVSSVPSGSNLGKLYVNTNNELIYVDENGNRATLSSGGNTVISGNLVVSGSIETLGQIFDGNSDLILSSAIGSVIAASGVLEFPSEPTVGTAHIVANNSHLIFSSSAGSVVAVSGALEILTTPAAHITATNSFLILSSSAGSNVVVSGNLLAGFGTTALPGIAFNGDAGSGFFRSGASTIKMSLGGAEKITFAPTVIAFDETNIRMGNSKVIYWTDRSFISSSANGSIEFLSNNGPTFLELGTGGSGSVVAPCSHLILSSSAGSVIAASGVLRVADGGSTAPSLSFLSDPDTGFWRSGENGIKWALGGGEYGNFSTVGLLLSNGLRAASNSDLWWQSRAKIDSPADSHIGFNANDNTPFLSFGNGVSGSITAPNSHLILSSSAGSCVYVSGTLAIEPYLRHIDLEAGFATLGPTAPTWSTIGTFRGLAFDADAETVNLSFEVPDDWDGSSDFLFKTYWTNEPGTAIGDGESVEWGISYQIQNFESGDVIDSNTSTKLWTAFTGSSTADKQGIVSYITLAAADADNPIVSGEVIGIQFSRSFSVDSYGADAVVMRWEVAFSSSGMPSH